MAVARTISLIGHSGTGKSTLASGLLKASGLDSEVDFDPSPQEKERGYSIDLGVGYCSIDGETLNVLDTPGASEFVEEVHKGVYMSDMSLLLVDSEKGVEVHTEKVWDIADEKENPTMVLINKMDKDEANFLEVLSSLREELDGTFIPLEIPLVEDGEYIGIVDIPRGEASYFDRSETEIPEEYSQVAGEERENLLEELAEQDDELMMMYLEEEEIGAEQINRALKSGVGERAFTPVVSAAAETGSRVETLLNQLLEFTPAPSEIEESSSKAQVFNQLRDPYLGRLSFVRLLSDGLAEGDEFYNLRNDEELTIQDIYRFQGNDQDKVSDASQGEIVALGKLENLELGDTLSTDASDEPADFVRFPRPVYSRAIVPETQDDESKMSTALQELSSIKATIEFYRDEVTKELILSGMGNTHLDVFRERLKSDFNVSILMNEPQIPYKRSIGKKARAQYRHKKQSGGRGQYAEVYLEVQPLQRGEGFEFTNNIKGGNIPSQFIPGVEKGIVEALNEGYPITDLEAIVYDGDHHPVDSSEMAFKIAAREVTKKAVEEANIVLLEPVLSCTVTTPGDYTGDIVSDLNGRRARIQGTEMSNGDTVINATVPQAEAQNYAMELKSLTQGRASFQMEFLQYQKVPENIAERIMEKAG